jgi:hypothetical protein
MSNEVQLSITQPSLCECGSKFAPLSINSEDTWGTAGVEFTCPVCGKHIQHTWEQFFSFLFPTAAQKAGLEQGGFINITDQLVGK